MSVFFFWDGVSLGRPGWPLTISASSVLRLRCVTQLPVSICPLLMTPARQDFPRLCWGIYRFTHHFPPKATKHECSRDGGPHVLILWSHGTNDQGLSFLCWKVSICRGCGFSTSGAISPTNKTQSTATNWNGEIRLPSSDSEENVKNDLGSFFSLVMEPWQPRKETNLFKVICWPNGTTWTDFIILT